MIRLEKMSIQNVAPKSVSTGMSAGATAATDAAIMPWTTAVGLCGQARELWSELNSEVTVATTIWLIRAMPSPATK